VAERLNWDRELSEEDFRTYAQLWSGEFLATTAGDRTVLVVRHQDEGAWNVVDDEWTFMLVLEMERLRPGTTVRFGDDGNRASFWRQRCSPGLPIDLCLRAQGTLEVRSYGQRRTRGVLNLTGDGERLSAYGLREPWTARVTGTVRARREALNR